MVARGRGGGHAWLQGGVHGCGEAGEGGVRGCRGGCIG